MPMEVVVVSARRTKQETVYKRMVQYVAPYDTHKPPFPMTAAYDSR